MYRIVNRIDKIDKQDLLVVLKEDDGGGGRMRGHSKRIRKRQCLRDTKTVVLNLGYLYPQGVRKLKVGGTRHAS